MVNLYVWTLVWILVFHLVFGRIVDDSNNGSNDHRATHRKLFASMDDRTTLPNVIVETPNVRLVRKKRSISREEVEATDQKSRKPTLLDFSGPAIVVLNDTESPHTRVKRDGSELDEAPSALSSQDSNYLKDLEDSFALSALEAEAQNSEDSGGRYEKKFQRSEFGSDSSRSLARPKRTAPEDYKGQRYENNDVSVNEKISASDDSLFNSDKAVSNDRLDEIESSIPDASSLDLSTDSTHRGNEITDVSTPADSLAKSVEYFSRSTLDGEYFKNITYRLDSSTSMVQTNTEAEYNETDTKRVEASSKISYLDNFTRTAVTSYRADDSENEDDVNIDSSKKEKVTKRETEEKDHRPEVSVGSFNSSLKDDNSISRYRLDDVYPEIVEDPGYPSSMVQLVRTKRFGDGIVNPETPDVSYANELDNSGTADEPYAEDNGIIDSMLSKVDYRSTDDEEIYSPKHKRTPIRSKRGLSPRRTRKKPGGERRRSKKRKKSHRGREKKHHRPKIKRSKLKRESRYPSERANRDYEQKFDINVDNVGDGKLNAVNGDAVSPHDGRRRRESEVENDENFNPEPNEAADSDRRDLRDSGDVAKVAEIDYNRQISRCAEARSKANEEAKTREKRESTLRELKYFQNIRETDGGPNRSGEIIDKHSLSVKVSRPVQDIQQLAEELLAKVNELHGYINEGAGSSPTNDSQSSGTSSSMVVRTTGDGSTVAQRVTNLDDSSSKTAVKKDTTEPEACRKYPGTWNRESGSSKSNGKSSRNLRAQRCSKKVRRKRTSHRKWDRWTDWSSCSVTCGRGRQIRWRHCIRNCSTAETEMEEKACQLPACAPGKFLGIFG